jgi:glutaredoxin
MGAFVLWGNPQQATMTWRPVTPGRRFQTVTLFTRNDCHLCEDAADLLKLYHRWLPTANEVDIDSDAQLIERFDTCVPVVAFDGKIRFRGRIDEPLLRRLIDGTPPQSVINR